MSKAPVFLNIGKAFYNTWHPDLSHELSKMQFSVRIIKLINSFPSNGKFGISIEGEMATPR